MQKKLGAAWTDRGRPAAGYFTKRLAEAWLRNTLDDARRGTLPGMVRTGATFADAAAEWLRYVEQDRRRKPSTASGYDSIVHSQLLPQDRQGGRTLAFAPEASVGPCRRLGRSVSPAVSPTQQI